MLKGVAEADESRGLEARVDVEAASEVLRLIRHDADRAAVHASEADQDVAGEVRLDLEEVPVVDDVLDDLVHVVGFVRVLGHDAAHRGVGAVDRIARFGPRRVVEVVRGQEGEQLGDAGETRVLAGGGEVRHATRPVVHHGAAELFFGHLLGRDRLDDVRTGDEHVARVLDHPDEVGDRRAVDRAAGAGAEDRRDLRDDTARERVAEEDVGVPSETLDTLLDARATRVVEADHRSACPHGEVHDLADLLGVCAGEAPGRRP